MPRGSRIQRAVFTVCSVAVVVHACSRRTTGPQPAVAPDWVVGGQLVPTPAALELGEGLEIHGFVADPLIGNPVAIAVDDRCRLLVVETHRDLRSVFDVTQRPAWVRDDLALRTLDDRRAFLARQLADTPELLTADSEVLRLVVDDDRDGRADRSTVLADGFRDPAAGTAGGVLAAGTDVWFACVPDLWRLPGAGAEVRAEDRERLLTGFGVHVGVRGHDLQGLALGPDGRIYFSVGDRGAQVTTSEGASIDVPDTGAVFRCEPDGTALEVVATGLRNPKELAFDADGNLFTADSGTVGADRSRVLHVVAGGDYGWRTAYQYLPGFGPWVQEGVWKGGIDGFLSSAGSAARGPAGLDYHPGTGFDRREVGRFVLCDFPLGVVSFAMVADGATFRVDDVRWLLRGLKAPDATFGPDGALWVADRVDGSGRPERGRVYRVAAQFELEEPTVREVRRLLAQGFGDCAVDELAGLLEHGDLRVRQRSHLELAARGAAGHARLVDVLTGSDVPRARLHAVFGLAVAARRHGADRGLIVRALGDADPIVRARAAQACGDLRAIEAVPSLQRLLRDGSGAERLDAALALARLGDAGAVPDLVEMIAEAAGEDAFLRHAGVVALQALLGTDELAALVGHADPPVRRAALIALRRSGSVHVERFLDDADEALRNEAARAIHDAPIEAALPALADRLATDSLPAAARSRVIAAALRVGRSIDAERLGALAWSESAPVDERVLAMRALGQWADPDDYDPVLGLWRPIAARDSAPARRALATRCTEIVRASDPSLIGAFGDAAGAFDIVEAAEPLARVAADESRNPAVRAAALTGLVGIGPVRLLASAVEAALESDAAVLVEPALGIATKVDGVVAIDALVERLATTAEDLRTRQAAYRALGSSSSESSEALLLDAVVRLGELPAALRLDVLEAAERRGTSALRDELARRRDPASDDRLATWRVALDGGDPARGRETFERPVATYGCLQCHAVAGVGGSAGPALDHVGRDRVAEEILESIVLPAAKVVDGYDASMPNVIESMTLAELRDLVAYLRSLR